MTISVINTTGQAQWYAPEQEGEPKTEFKVRPLTQSELLEVENDGFDHEARRFKAKGLVAAVRYGLLDWRGMVDAAGNELKFSRLSVALLPRHILAGIAVHVIEISQLSEAERKN